MQILTIIQARMTSTRLPGKVLLPIAGKSMLEHVIDAAPEPRIVALPNELASLEVVKILLLKNIDSFIPSIRIKTDDVLGRFAACIAKLFPNVHFILRLTADCPMLTRDDVETFLHSCYYGSNYMYDPYTIYTNRPLDMDGLDMELFSTYMLTKAHERATMPDDREHVTPYMYRTYNVQRHSVRDIPRGYETPGKCSVDTIDEYDYVRKLMEAKVCIS